MNLRLNALTASCSEIHVSGIAGVVAITGPVILTEKIKDTHCLGDTSDTPTRLNSSW
jgi:hypothetical protein